MTEAKTPQAGEWWCSVNSTLRVFIVGRTCSGRIVAVETKSGDVVAWPAHSFAGMYHEPDCTGWDWKPEKWPKYYAPRYSDKNTFIRRDSEDTYVVIRRDGSSSPVYRWRLTMESSPKITEAEALARVKPAPVESPQRTYTKLYVDRQGIGAERWGERVMFYSTEPLGDQWAELKHDGTGFYVEEGKS